MSKSDVFLLKALADGTRIKIVRCLMAGEQCACAIVPYAGKAQPTVSQHLKVLENAGILGSRRDGKNIFYKIRDRRAIRILEVVGLNPIRMKAKC